jgi:hypothetical protein
MKISVALLLTLLFSLAGCHKPLAHPEEFDPVYRDLKTEANKAMGNFKEKEKATQEARKAFDLAPIQTGQRLNARDEYFEALNREQKSVERYRYLALKAELRRKYDASSYPRYFKDKLPWPNVADWEEYEVEKRMANAPREWNPENRIKERALASIKNKKPPETEEHE